MKDHADLFNLNGKIAVITGGSGVLGGAIASGFLRAGAQVVILGRQQQKLHRRAAALSKVSQTICAIQCDVLDQEALSRTNEEILENYARIDILINAAGGNIAGATIGPEQNIFEMDIKAFSEVCELNLDGSVLPTLIFGKTMAEQKTGSIINISSMASQRAITRVAGYSAAKAAIDNFTRWMAIEVAHKYGEGIRVNAIAPGFFISEQNRSLLTNSDGSYTERGKTIINMTPFKRFGEPEELIGTALWLASDASKFVTGTIIAVDGGFSAFSGV